MLINDEFLIRTVKITDTSLKAGKDVKLRAEYARYLLDVNLVNESRTFGLGGSMSWGPPYQPAARRLILVDQLVSYKTALNNLHRKHWSSINYRRTS